METAADILTPLVLAVTRAQAAEALAAVRTNAALIALKEHATWAEMEVLTGLTVHQLQYRLYRETAPSVMGKRLSDEEKAARKAARVPAPRVDEGPGLSIAAAARMLERTRATVYAMIERGELETIEDDKGRRRVATGPDGQPLKRGPGDLPGS